METTYTSAKFQWGHDITAVVRIAPPTLVQEVDDEGVVIFDENNEPVMVPEEDWTPTPEQVELDTIVILDATSQQQGNPILFRFPVDKALLAQFIATYVEHLDGEGRSVVRQALTDATGVETATAADMARLRLIRGGSDN